TLPAPKRVVFCASTARLCTDFARGSGEPKTREGTPGEPGGAFIGRRARRCVRASASAGARAMASPLAAAAPLTALAVTAPRLATLTALGSELLGLRTLGRGED